MSGAFTPGPWEAKLFHVHVEDKGTVCSVANPWNDEAERQANTHLIAAAPELYALGEVALDEMEQSLALLLESHCLLDDELNPKRETLEEDVREEVERLEKGIADARTLLAKARGEQVPA